jgi:hypothetical protein
MRRYLCAVLATAVLLVAPACDGTGPRVSQPTIDFLSPDWSVPGGEFHLHGATLGPDSVDLFIGSHRAAVQVVSPHELRVTVPDQLAGGQRYDVRVVNPDGGEVTLEAGLEILTPPRVDSVDPVRGTVGTEVAIHGSAFSTDSVAVFFGDVEVEAEPEGGSLYVFAPEGLVAGNDYDIRVVNRGRAADTLVAAFEAVPPLLTRINGVSRPTGIKGMTVILDGDAFGDRIGDHTVYFESAGGAPIEAEIVDADEDWTNSFVVTSVPEGVGDTTRIWVETPTGTSASIEFTLLTSSAFSPSNIHWNETTRLPEGLHGLGAAFVPVEDGASPANYVFVLGGADVDDRAVESVHRARVLESGALEAWQEQSSLPEGRAHATVAAATAYTAALDTTTTAAYLYMLGGIDPDGETVQSVRYAHVDLAGEVGAWETATALPEPLHSASAVIFRGFLYLAGGAGADGEARSTLLRAMVFADGRLGEWETLSSLPGNRAFSSLVGFGPFLYTIGGETGSADPASTLQTGSETGQVHLARINLRTGALTGIGWQAVSDMPKVRSKHSAIFSGGSLFLTSGVYPGQPGSTENIYAGVRSDGTLEGWNGATGSRTIQEALGYSLYNQAMVTFVDAQGNGRVLVLGGAKRQHEGEVSDRVLFY